MSTIINDPFTCITTSRFPGDVVINADDVRLRGCYIAGSLFLNGERADVQFCTIRGGVVLAAASGKLEYNHIGPPAQPISLVPSNHVAPNETCCGGTALRADCPYHK